MDIRELRRRRGWTQAELARRVGTDHVTVSRWERGVAEPRAAARRRMQELFAVPRTPRSVVVFAEDPTARLRKLDRMRREQIELQRRARIPGWTR